MRKLQRIAALLYTLLLAASAAAQVRDPIEPAQRTVRMGQISLSFYAVTAALVQEVLQRLGHDVEVTQGSHGQIFPRLGAGEVDLLVAAWLPHGHAVYWERYGAQAVQLATLYEGARFAWMVPVYIPQTEVASVADLAKSDVAARMEKVIQGTGRDSGNMMVSAEVMQAYGLEAAGYRLQPGGIPEFIGAYDRGIAARQWFVMPLWWPHYINILGTMRPLAEPRGLLGPANDGTLVASKRWVERAPKRTVVVLGRIRLGLQAVAEMDYMVNVEGKSPQQAARVWIDANRALVDSWFTER